MPGKTLSSPSIVDKSEMHPRKIDNEVEQESPKNPPKETTTTSVERSTDVVASPSPVVVVSSLAPEEDLDQEITDKLLAEFGEFSRTDAREIAEQVTHSRGYALDAAESARAYATSHRVRNRAGLFMRALKEGWKAPKASEPPKRQKARPAIPEPPLNGEAKRAEVAQMEARLEIAKAQWILADAAQRSTWLERMDTVSRKLAPMNGSEPRRGFLLCLAAILESPPEMKSTRQSSELTAGRATAA